MQASRGLRIVMSLGFYVRNQARELVIERPGFQPRMLRLAYRDKDVRPCEGATRQRFGPGGALEVERSEVGRPRPAIALSYGIHQRKRQQRARVGPLDEDGGSAFND
jgi:hypothetical protein